MDSKDLLDIGEQHLKINTEIKSVSSSCEANFQISIKKPRRTQHLEQPLHIHASSYPASKSHFHLDFRFPTELWEWGHHPETQEKD